MENWFSASKSFIIICFFYKSIPLEKLMRCKTFFSKSDIFYSFLFEIFVFYKKCFKSEAFEILDSKHDALYKKGFKNRFFFSKYMIQVLFLNDFFFRNNFSKNAQNSLYWRLYGVFWPTILFFESQFSKKSWFSNNTFLTENWCVANILTQVLTLCGNQFKLWHEVFYFFL